ncbi:MAG TPA: sugar phosphate isomerase/epimerase, partial [Chloroflexota bacterium]|nr:sugar phosphate isomerase/epimerase [Chloroflexota bacterium]
MRIGIFAKTFVRPTLEETLDAVAHHGIHCIQFNLATAGLSSMPAQITAQAAGRIQRELAARGLTMSAVSGTFNMIDPDEQRRQDGLRSLRVIAQACAAMGTSVITLCTGTRDADDMWRRHPENDTPSAWRDLLSSMQQAVTIAEDHAVTL